MQNSDNNGKYDKALVAAALKLDAVSLEHVIEFRPQQAKAFVAKAESQCCVDEAHVLGLVEGINALLPHNSFGGQSHSFRIGREGSRVVYLRLAKLDAEFAPLDYEALTAKLNEIAGDCLADECDVREDTATIYVVRFWWD